MPVRFKPQAARIAALGLNESDFEEKFARSSGRAAST
jgi:hypothetical protein